MPAASTGPWTADKAGETVTAFVKARTGEPWSQVKRWCERGKIFVDGAVVTDEAARVSKGQQVEVRLGAPRPRDEKKEGTLVFDDAHVVVIDKPAGVSSVPYEDRETGTAMDLIRGAWRRMGVPATSVPLHVVHRIDRATSGLLMFAKSKRAERALAMQAPHARRRSAVPVRRPRARRDAHDRIAPRRRSRRRPARLDDLPGSRKASGHSHSRARAAARRDPRAR